MGEMKVGDKCPIWGSLATLDSFEHAAGSAGPHFVSGYHIDSQRAGGRYSIEKLAYDEVLSSGFDEQAKARLTTWLIDQRRLGTPSPNISLEIARYAKTSRSLSAFSRADRLLGYIAARCPYLGSVFHFFPTINSTPHDDALEMLAVSESQKKEELSYLLDFLRASGYVDPGPSSQVGRLDFIVSPKGYAHLAELEKKKTDSSQGFVAMWFHDSMDEFYREGFEQAILRAGYKPLRIDRKDHNNKIDDEIIAEIRRSRFLVADFTQGPDGARGGVYYEAGFAHGLGIPVIFTCHAESLGKVHFDTRQYSHIVWKTTDELRDRLAQRITATLGDGPLSKMKLS